ncbi:MAG: TRAP transporter TatT component family protein [Vicinamibacteria bacterium]
MRRAALALALALAANGCSLKQIAVNSLGDALAGGSSSFASDDDPELVWDATPFALKTLESLLAESPRHRGLLLASASGFTQYAFASLEQDADMIEERDLARATELRARARGLYLRGREYALRGLELDLPGLRERLRTDTQGALAGARPKHVALLYWAAASWGGAIALAVNDSSLSADQGLVEALAHRALELDEAWDRGSLHEFFLSWDAGRASVGGSYERAKQHYQRAVALNGNTRAFPHVGFAESVALARQDRPAFEQALRDALAVDPDAVAEQKLANRVAQRRARWLLARADELFIE